MNPGRIIVDRRRSCPVRELRECDRLQIYLSECRRTKCAGIGSCPELHVLSSSIVQLSGHANITLMRVCLCGITTILSRYREIAHLHVVLTCDSRFVVIDKACGYSCVRNIRADHLGLLHKNHHRWYLASVTERFTLPIARLFSPGLEIAHSSLDFI